MLLIVQPGMGVHHWMYLLPLVGAAGCGLVAYFCHIRACSQGESSPLATLSYVHIVFTTAAAFGSFPDALASAGIVIIVSAGLYILHRETVRRGRSRPVATPGID